MKKLLFLIIPIFFSNCSEAPPNIPKENNVQKEKAEYQRAKSLLWIEARKDENLRFLYDCNTANELYQVELSNDPFKDFVYITVDLSNPDFDLIYYSRFKPRRIHHKGATATNKPPKQALTIVNPFTQDTIFFIYKKPIQIKRQPKDAAINQFFTKTIWELYPKDENRDIDPEIWRIIGRKDGKEIQLMRNSFTDSIYYTNIQHILDICKIKDYSYREVKSK